MRVGILGAGKIAAVMADTLNRMEGAECAAIGARDWNRAKQFAGQFGIPAAYGSYEELASDPALDLIYIATPHSHHGQHMKLCLSHGKNVLCEKAFTATAKEAEEVLTLAKEKRLLVAEAIWTRYMPSRSLIGEVMESGILGEITSLTANLGYAIRDVERMREPGLAGGALLDLGVYPINFALMAFGNEIENVASTAAFLDTGVDASDSITLTWKDGRMAVLHANMCAQTDRRGMIFGDKAYMEVQNINNCEAIRIYEQPKKGQTGHRLLREISIPKQITGYEYEILACKKALQEGKLECEEMPHAETLRVMRLMDQIRECWKKE
ncbi:Gfo/Idh/MocA family protein [Hominifimenecus sp. rT4P-3]|uniref:Gfo/Idh/MocA family protein n=1 Tax=Hominifimenecus sp. rT4P-3 TaxID=3242979 RepID=UPI003DA2396B